MRAVLEERLGYLATLKRTPSDVAEVERLLSRLDRINTTSPSPSNIAKWASLNQQFHMRLFQAANRTQLLRLVQSLRDAVERYVRIDGATPGRLEEAQAEHHQIFAM